MRYYLISLLIITSISFAITLSDKDYFLTSSHNHNVSIDSNTATNLVKDSMKNKLIEGDEITEKSKQLSFNQWKEFLIGGIIGLILFVLFDYLRKALIFLSNQFYYKKRIKRYYKACVSDNTADVHYIFKAYVKNNILKLKGYSYKKGDFVSGKIEFNQSMKNFGKGYYNHEYSAESNQYKFGFMNVQIMGNILLVHREIYTRKEGKIDLSSNPIVWININKEEWKRLYKEKGKRNC